MDMEQPKEVVIVKETTKTIRKIIVKPAEIEVESKTAGEIEEPTTEEVILHYVHCPAPGCNVFKGKKYLSELRDHYKKSHPLDAARFDLHTEGSLKQAGKAKQVHFKEQKPVEFWRDASPSEWQKAVDLGELKNLKRSDAVIHQNLEALGVVVVRRVLTEAESNLLLLAKKCVIEEESKPRPSKLKKGKRKASEKDVPFLIPRILGNLSMVTMGKSQILNAKESDEALGLSRCALVSLQDFVSKKIQGDWVMEENLSFVFSPNPENTFRQHIHSDSLLGNKVHGLLVLTDDPAPTLFLPKQTEVLLSDLPAQDQQTRQIIDPSTREMVEKIYRPFYDLEATIPKLRPVAPKLQKGDIVLFKSNMIHCGDKSKNKKCLMFFTLGKNSDRFEYPTDIQMHAGYVGQMIHGFQEKGDNFELFQLLKAHDDCFVHEHIDYGIQMVLRGSYQEAYSCWLSKQPLVFRDG
jgi:hypothetical protein